MANELVEEEAKVIFRLEKDDDDYPPDDYESLWATRMPDGMYRIDNIPFFIRGISPGDVITVIKDDRQVFFDRLVVPSANSVLRVIVYNADEVSVVRDSLRDLGCESELSHVPQLISIEIPAEVDFDVITNFLEAGETRNAWEYETASIRH